MPISTYVPRDTLRTEFSAALSEMYRVEVPLYGDLVELVDEINGGVVKKEGDHLGEWQSADRLNVERHGAIRLGTPHELHTISRLFDLLGMYPVGYYDLSTSGVPVHSTAFRPLSPSALSINPFRVFTSLLRPELILDVRLREACLAILSKRNIFHPHLLPLIAKAENQGGLGRSDAAELVEYALETFRWHERSLVCRETYSRMRKAHPLLADIAGFRGPHINHLTPRVLDIDAAQKSMEGRGIPPKDIIEGPPNRLCPILLRQTSFKALTEPILFAEFDSDDGSIEEEAVADDFAPGSVGSMASARTTQSSRRGSGGEMGSHRARFGEIESRGAALTRKGHELYLSLLAQVPVVSGETNEAHQLKLAVAFEAFPDTWAEIRTQKLAYFRCFARPTSSTMFGGIDSHADAESRLTLEKLEELIVSGKVGFEPIVYEDFLPASAAGIFQSNLVESASASAVNGEMERGGHSRERTLTARSAREDDTRAETDTVESSREVFERALGGKVADYWELYEAMEEASLAEVAKALGMKR